VRILFSNHEEMFLQSFEDKGALRQLMRLGGKETILPFGVTRDEHLEMTVEELQAAIAARTPSEDLDFMSSFEDMTVIGDYIFVHAGIWPGVGTDAYVPSRRLANHSYSDYSKNPQ
jgi:serine/threonine protein phosphatase 1